MRTSCEREKALKTYISQLVYGKTFMAVIETER